MVEPILEAPRETASGEPFKTGSAQIVTYSPEHVVIDANLPTREAVVLDDMWYPGWTATIDGASNSIYPANFLDRAVMVPAGRHVIKFDFEMPGLRLGLDVSALGVVVCLGLLLLAQRERRLRAS
jgi:uncharacterized membrane protein YfhO